MLQQSLRKDLLAQIRISAGASKHQVQARGVQAGRTAGAASNVDSKDNSQSNDAVARLRRATAGWAKLAIAIVILISLAGTIFRFQRTFRSPPSKVSFKFMQANTAAPPGFYLDDIDAPWPTLAAAATAAEPGQTITVVVPRARNANQAGLLARYSSRFFDLGISCAEMSQLAYRASLASSNYWQSRSVLSL